MLMIAVIAYFVVCLQVILGTAMISTASAAASRHFNAGNRSFDALLRAVGWSSVALGIWGLLCTFGLALSASVRGAVNAGIVFLYFVSFVYSILILLGGWMQSGVAAALLSPKPIEDQRKSEWKIGFLRAIGWFLVLMPFGPLAGVYALVSAILGGTMRMQQESLLLILGIAMRTQAPLAEEVESLADSSRGRYRSRLRRLAKRLRHGDRLSDALWALPGLVPVETVTAIRLGEDLGNVVPVIQQEAARLRRREEERLQGRFSVAGLAFYLCGLLWVMTSIVGFLMFWIVPKMKRIFLDFGTQLPATTRLLIQAANFFEDYWAAIVLWIGIAVVLPAFFILRRTGWAGIDWHALSLFYPRFETPGILRSLAQAIAVRRPLKAALEGLELHHDRRHIRKRMRRVRDEADRGRDCFQPLSRCGLLYAREVAVLVSAERAGNLAWALEQVAENIERRQRDLGQAIGETIQPVMLIALGTVVFFVCASFFFPLIRLIQGMS